MSAQEFITNKLNNLIIQFPNFIFKYKYDKEKSTHIIEVDPLNEFKSNKEYLITEADFVYEFDNKFIPESVLFVSEESLTRVITPDLVFAATNFIYFSSSLLNETNITFDVDWGIELITEYSSEIYYALAA